MKREVKLSKRCRRSLHQKPNVIGVGKGYREKKGQQTDEPAIVVFVSKKMPQSELTKSALLPHYLNGNAIDVVEIGEVRLLNSEDDESQTGAEAVSALNEPEVRSANRRSRQRPAPGGVSIGHYKSTAGTLGAVVKDHAAGKRLILSNNHVLANSSAGNDGRAKPGDAVLQPGPYDGGAAGADLLGHLERFIPIRRTFNRSHCMKAQSIENTVNKLFSCLAPRYRVSLQRAFSEGNLVDAALVRPVEESAVSDDILQLGAVKGTAKIDAGEEVVFSGRTSGVVRGKVIGKDVSLFITMDPGEQVYFTDQLITTAVSRPGDSGSLLMDNNNHAVGLLFAGSDRVSICNRIDHVCDLLKIQFD